MSRIKTINTQNFPVLVMGDLNVEPHSEVVAILKKELSDSKEKAVLVFGPEGTYNAFKYREPVTRRIDYIMVSKQIKVNKYAVLSSAIEFKYPSDHFPVFVQLVLE